MRGIVPDLPSGVPLAHRLPGIYQEEEFTQRFLESFDTALAPVVATLDGLPGYVDPWLAPDDFVDWLAGWVGVDVDESWSLPQRRAVVSGAALVHRRRGTREGIAEAVRLAVGGGCEVEVSDSGGTTFSEAPGATPPGSSPPTVTVRILCADPDAVDVRRVEALVRSIKPAHVAHTIDVAKMTARKAKKAAAKADEPPAAPAIPAAEVAQEHVAVAPDEGETSSAPVSGLAPSEASRAADTPDAPVDEVIAGTDAGQDPPGPAPDPPPVEESGSTPTADSDDATRQQEQGEE